MPSSPFDDLLRELDELPPPGEGAAPRDTDREQALRLLMEVSKKLEVLAIKIDPTPEDHPLHGLTLPDPARERLQAIVVELMEVQKSLNAIESELTQPAEEESSSTPMESRTNPSEPDPLPTGETPPGPPLDQPTPILHHSPREEPLTSAPISSKPELEVFTPDTQETKPPATAAPTTPNLKTDAPVAVEPVAPATPSITQAKLTQEKEAFLKYKAQWDAAFAADQSLRDQHPEVLAYYQQMEAYFQQAEVFLAHSPSS